jgi:hypothetical protein
MLLLILDTIAGIVFVVFQVQYIIESDFNIQSNKAMLVIIAWGITGVVLVYTIFDSQRFVAKWSDKVLCLVSCLLLKPVVLPILFSGSFFRSPIAKQKTGKYIFEIGGIQETNFMMAV